MGRMEKINEAMRREIGQIVHREIKDPRLEFVTITHVEVTKDLQHAKVYFSVLGDHEQAERAEQGLESARGFVRKLVGQRVRMRYTPELEFLFDESIEYSARIEAALEDIKNESSEDYQNN